MAEEENTVTLKLINERKDDLDYVILDTYTASTNLCCSANDA